MFEFFVALFGGIFWGAKRSNDKAKIAEFERQQQHRVDRMNEFQNKYLDSDLEAKMFAYVRDIKNREDIIDALTKSFDSVFAENNRNLFCPTLPNRYNVGSENDNKNTISAIVRILMATHGKVMYWDMQHGLDMDSQKTAQLYYCKWFNTELIRHGVTEPLVFVQTMCPNYDSKRAYTLDKMSGIINGNIYGKYVFAPYCSCQINGGEL